MTFKKIKLCFLFTLFLLLCSFSLCFASESRLSISDNTALFLQANQLYEKGEYSKAAETYGKVIATGKENGTIYFNLGNAYSKLNQKGLAIFNYEKARRFIPYDKGLQTNLNLALQGVNEGEINWGRLFYSLVTHWVPLNWLALASSICFYILILLIIVGILFPNRLAKGSGKHALCYKVSVYTISCFFLVFVFITTITFLDQQQTQAIAIKGNTPVLSEPKPEGTSYFNLDEGSRVAVSSVKGNWLLIRRQDGKRGWVERQNLEVL